MVILAGAMCLVHLVIGFILLSKSGGELTGDNLVRFWGSECCFLLWLLVSYAAVIHDKVSAKKGP